MKMGLRKRRLAMFLGVSLCLVAVLWIVQKSTSRISSIAHDQHRNRDFSGSKSLQGELSPKNMSLLQGNSQGGRVSNSQTLNASDTAPRNGSLNVEGLEFRAAAAPFPEPYVVRYRAFGTGFDRTQPTEIVDALWSSANRDPGLYLSLLDEGAKLELQRSDAESGGKILDSSSREEAFPKEEELQTVFSHWVEFEKDAKTYRVLVGKQIIKGVDNPGLTLSLVKEGDAWFQTFDLDGSQLLFVLGTRRFEDLFR